MRLLTLFLSVLGLAAALWANARFRLPYNSEGTYFDAATGVVIDRAAAEVLAVASAIFLLAATALFIRLLRPRKTGGPRRAR